MSENQKGLSVPKRFVSRDRDALAGVNWEERSSVIRNPDGSVVFEMNNIRIPNRWSQVATDIIAQKYFRKAGVPTQTKKVPEKGIPEWLHRSVPDESPPSPLPKHKPAASATDPHQ